MRFITFRLPLAVACLALLEGQNTKPPTPAEYGQWEALTFGGRQPGKLSPDGKWLAYGVNRSNGNNELRLARTDGTVTKTVAFGLQPAFSADSRWAAYAIARSEAQEEKIRKEKKPIQNKLGLTNLATGEQSEIEGIETFVFSPSGTWLAMRRYAPEKPATPAGGGDAAAKPPEDESPVGVAVLAQTRDASARCVTVECLFNQKFQQFGPPGRQSQDRTRQNPS
jgi:WD40 repeat protein